MRSRAGWGDYEGFCERRAGTGPARRPTLNRKTLQASLGDKKSCAQAVIIIEAGDFRFCSTADAELRGLCRVGGAHPILARGCPGSVHIHQGDDHGERFRVEGGDLRAPELALLIG